MRQPRHCACRLTWQRLAQSSFLAPTSRGQRMRSATRTILLFHPHRRTKSYRCSGSECFRARPYLLYKLIHLFVRPSVCPYTRFLRVSQRPIIPCGGLSRMKRTKERIATHYAIGTRVVRYRTNKRKRGLRGAPDPSPRSRSQDYSFRHFDHSPLQPGPPR